MLALDEYRDTLEDALMEALSHLSLKDSPQLLEDAKTSSALYNQLSSNALDYITFPSDQTEFNRTAARQRCKNSKLIAGIVGRLEAETTYRQLKIFCKIIQMHANREDLTSETARQPLNAYNNQAALLLVTAEEINNDELLMLAKSVASNIQDVIH